jgi:uncharacterized membrane protein
MRLPHHVLGRQLKARPRLFISALIALLVYLSVPNSLALHEVTRLIVAWNAGVCLYLALCGIMIYGSSHEDIRSRACLQDDGQFVILSLVVLSAVASLAAIIGELSVVKDMHGALKAEHIGLAAFTIASSWAFTHMMFAMHYAHDYYSASNQGRSPGLSFPDEPRPDYLDFLYFACVIGTSGQTADVSFVSKSMRRIGLIHCVLAFFFNTTLLALTINIAASLF